MQDCWDMVRYKTCGNMNQKMSCENEECSYAEPPNNLQWSWLKSDYYNVQHCKLKKIFVKAKNKDDFVFDQNCKASDLKCHFQNQQKIIVWEKRTIHQCRYAKYAKLPFVYDNNLLYGLNHSLVLQLTEEVRACNTTIRGTREGFYIADKGSENFLKINKTLNILEHFTLADIDSQYLNIYIKLHTKMAKINCFLYTLN